ncbi:MAG: ABC transporter permease, partial [Verrucomicrobia bacterium]|nr:ABC transporter permease [Verrucomicrobiota bacterium]
MNIATLIARSAWFHRRANLLVALGTMVATAILTGARLTGDSFRFSLSQLAQQRLGDTRFALQARNRDFPADIASRLAAETGAPVIPVLTAPGVAVFNPLTEAPPRQINAVQVLGVDPTFWSLAPGAGLTLADDAVALNARLAAALNVRPGDRIALRLRRPSLMPEDAPLASRGDPFTRISLRVTAIVPDTQLGRFNLNADQRSPYNAFVPLPVIQDAIDRKGLANLLLVGKDAPAALDAVALNDALGRVWRIADGGVRVRAFPATGTLDVSSDRIFLDRAVAEAARPPAASADATPAAGMLAYLVNSIATAGATVPHSTPYAFVAALSPSADSRLSPVPADMRDDEVIINRWLAKALAVGSGDRITLAYWRFQSVGGLSEESRPFRVRDVIEMDVLAAERERMPAFPGLREAARCADWDIGLPMDEEKLRDKDNEAYWEQFGMTPKAFVTLAAGQAMWASPFGDLMSVRRLGAAPADVDALSAQLSRHVPPAALGLSFMPVRAWADWSLAGATDVGGLFLGMSSFLIIAALMLTALLFVFGLQQRASNLGLLRAVGFTNRQVARLALWEGAVVAACGAVPGAWAGTLYTRALIAALGGPWSPSVGGTPVTYHAAPGTVSISGAIGFVCALAAMALTLRALLREPALQLLQADFSQSRPRATAGGPARRLLASLLAPTALAAALGVMTWTLLRPPPNPSEPFFLAGALMLAGCLGLARGALGRGAGAPTSADRLTLAGVGVRNITRRRGRSM